MSNHRQFVDANRDWILLPLGLAALAGLIFIGLSNYLLFHALAEGFCIAVACAAFVLAWNTFKFTDNGYLRFLGIAFFFVAGLDFFHMLAYKGMGIFPTYDANLPTQLWIAARATQSLSLLVAPAFLKRRVNRHAAAVIYTAISVTVLGLAFGRLFPDCYVEGEGLTPFKIVSEYIVSLLLVGAILHMVYRRTAFNAETFRWMAVALSFTILSELAFTIYIHVYDVLNVAGHIFKVLAFYFIYRAIVETGLRKPYAALFWDVQQRNEQLEREIDARKRAEDALRESESRVRRTLQSVLSPVGNLDRLELRDIIDVEAIQSLVDDFYALTQTGIAILDLEGNVLVAAGWQDICTQFHRVHPETLRHCIESDTQLSSGVPPGSYKLYKCKNNMWDMATPIVVGGRHVGNLFLGQFFFDDEVVDTDVFRQQARTCGFDEVAYLAALDRVPRWPRERVETVFRYYMKFATMISQLSHSNLSLAQALSDRDRLLVAHRESEQKFRSYVESAPYGIFVADQDGRYVEVNDAACQSTGYARDELLGMQIAHLIPPDHLDAGEWHFRTLLERGVSVGEVPFVTKDGRLRWWSVNAVRLSDTRFLAYTEDVTERRWAEEALRQTTERLRIQHEIDTAILSARSAEEIAHTTLHHLRDLVPYLVASISEVDLVQQRGRDIAVLTDGSHRVRPAMWYSLSMAGHLAESIRQGQTRLVQDIATLPDLSPLERSLAARGGRAYVNVPMMAQDAPVGALSLVAREPHFFRPEHVEVLEEVADSLAVAMQQARLLEQTQQDAETKALLLREVNHRVLNNLTMILSILDMERGRPLEDQRDFHAALQDVRSCIEGITTVHRMLSSTQWSPLELGEVARQVARAALSSSPMQHHVDVTVDVPGDLPPVSAKDAVALALVINELTTNSLKYAFAGRAHGQIRIRIARLEGRKVQVLFCDDGPGLPDDVLQGERHNVGLWLVRANITHTLGGEVALYNDGGAVVAMTFPYFT
ncbi:MAG: PocR ligand-binding domain-containing protein [Anaerolineae bacterium]|nr:PocR ligand-binding domain-containing protein [Anaerolineae bacterium]